MLQSRELITDNKLLGLLSKPDLELLKPHLEWTELPLGKVLYAASEPFEHACFPVSGFCSVVAQNFEGVQTETGLIGREGFVGIPIVHYAESAPSEIVVQAEGGGFKISRTKLLQAIEKSRTLAIMLLQFGHVFGVQVGQTALSNGAFKINKRLARWLLMCHDRADADEFSMTHQFLSIMLSVRRAGITEAVSFLEESKAIQRLRGRIVVLNRKVLENIAGEAYGVPEKEYERLLK